MSEGVFKKVGDAEIFFVASTSPENAQQTQNQLNQKMYLLPQERQFDIHTREVRPGETVLGTDGVWRTVQTDGSVQIAEGPLKK